VSQGIEVLLPVYRTIRRWQDRNKVVDLPLFPCYLFVQTLLERKVEILKAPGVFSLVESGGRACEIEDGEIKSIIKATANPSQVTPHPYLKSGDRVRIRHGALAGIEGILTRFKNQFRVVLNLHLLNKAIAVEVDISTVERVGEGKSLAALSDSLM
jgi:transcription antitermination factor NusG